MTLLTSKPEQDVEHVWWYTRYYSPATFEVLPLPPTGKTPQAQTPGVTPATAEPGAEAAPDAEAAPGAPGAEPAPGATPTQPTQPKPKRLTVQDVQGEVRALREEVAALRAAQHSTQSALDEIQSRGV